MARHVCPECGATVSGNEQFCPTCGTFLEHEDEARHEHDFEEFELGAAPPPPPDSSRVPGISICPSCGAENASGNRHCEECGARLSQGPLPGAPRPAVQATAGVRAVVAIGGLLLGIILVALLFQLFSGDDPTETTPLASDTTTTTQVLEEPERLEPLDVQCSVEGVGSFVCPNVISGPDSLYQVNWVNLEEAGETLTITIRFRTAVTISRIDWTNISSDETRFRRNYRARALSISADDALVDVQRDLQNIPGTQIIPFSSLETFQVTITVQSVWDAELVEEQVFTELAIDEIEVIGRPATGATTTTDPDGAPEDTEGTEATTTTTEGG